MKTTRFYTFLIALLLLSATTTTFAQNDKQLEAKRPDKITDLPQFEVEEKGEHELEPWHRSPYLNVPLEKATVGELTFAFQKWLEAHPEEMKPNRRHKDDDVVKYQRLLYRWQMENGMDEVPVQNNERIDAFIKYEEKNSLLSRPESNNPDANWRLLGPVNNPEEVAFTEPAVSGNKSVDNAGLGRINCIEFSNWDTLNIWVGTSTGGVWKTWNGGKSWINISMNLPVMEISDIAIDQSNSNIIYIATGDRDGRGGWYGNGTNNARLYKTTDGGSNWFLINANFGTGTFIMNLWVHPQRTSEVIVVKRNGVFKSLDGGTTWTQTLVSNYISPFTPPNDIFYEGTAYANLTNPERLYSAYSKYYPTLRRYVFYVQKSDDFGKTWQNTDSVTTAINSAGYAPSAVRLAIAPSDANCLYVVSSEFDSVSRRSRFGCLFRTLDAGKTWQNRTRYPATGNILGWIMGDSSDVGSQDTYDLVLTVDPRDKERIFVGGVDMWGSTNGGTRFDKTTFWVNSLGESAHADHHWGEYQPISGSYFLATDGGLYKTRNLTPGDNAQIRNCRNGRDDLNELITQTFTPGCYTFPTKWEFVGNGISNEDLYALAVSKSDPTRVLVGAQDNGTLMRKDGKWYAVLGGDGFVPTFHPTNPNIFYGSLYYGWTFRTDDGGLTYRNVSAAIDAVDQGSWLTPMEISETNPNILIQARTKHLWRTTNGGSTWQIMSNAFTIGTAGNRISALAIAPSTANTVITARLYANTGGATVRELQITNDGGSTWVNRWSTAFPPNIITDIAIHPTQPNKIWISFNTGYLSTNTNQTRKMFYSADGGINWTNITAGLPDVPIWSVAVPANSTTNAVYVGTGVGVFYKDDTKSQFAEFQVGMPRGVMVTDLKIHDASGKIFAATYGRGAWSANLYDQPYDGGVQQQTVKVNRNLLLNVYPNPANDYIRIVWDDNNKAGQTLNVTDMYGRVMYNKTDFQGRTTVDISQYAEGIYTVQLTSGKEVLVKKFTVTK